MIKKSHDKMMRGSRIKTKRKQKCRRCGCTDDRACKGGCVWVKPNLCSGCAIEDDTQ